MKRKIYKILAIMFIFTFMFTFVGCKTGTDNEASHNFSTEWTSNDTAHWHECDDDGCTEISDYAEHVWNDGVENNGSILYTCTVCERQMTIDGYLTTFVCDNHVSVLIYNTQDVSGDGSQATTAYARDGESGKMLVDGNGQLNFKVILEEGYAVNSISITGSYNKIKNDPESDGSTNYYRITKITSDLTVNITTAKEDEVEGYSVTFNIPNDVTVTVFDTQDITLEGTAISNGQSVFAKTSAGVVSKTGSEQVNFVIGLPEGYEIDSVTADGTYKNIKADPESDGSTNYYRITKITSDISVTITIKEATENEGDDTNENYGFDIQYVSGTANCYTIEENSNGEYTVTFTTITQKSVYQISGQLNGNIVIDVKDTYKFELNMNAVSITSAYESPIVALSGDRVTLNQIEGTTNTIADYRAVISDDSQHSASIYSAVDLTLAGTGTLNVTSTNNNGIHTKDDLVAKELTLTVNCKDNALKGNDSVTISGGTYTLIAKQGDGIKSSNSEVKYEDDGVTVKKIQGTITITGGTVNIFAACDGIDASYNAEISGDAVVNINTSTYSSYSESVLTTTNDTLYVRTTNTDYSYSIYYYNSTSGEYIWKNANGYKKVTTESTGGRPGGVSGDSSTSYYYYEFDWLTDYTTFRVYAYSSSQTQGQDSSYYKRSDSMSTTTTKNTMIFSGSSFNSSLTTYSDSDYSRKGIKADNQVNISGGIIVIKSYDDAIHANNDVVLGDEDDTTDDYYGDGVINISGGNITITTKDDGIHADQDINISGGTITVITSYEGIEANRIYISDGTITVYSTDDAMNAAECNGAYTPLISISGGYVDLDVASGDTDTMDSNGNITISGGSVIIKNRQSNGSSMTGGTLDLDGTLSITGGNVISIGCWCNEASMSSQASSTSTTLSSGTYAVKNSSGTEICSFSLTTSYKGYKIYCYGKSGTYYLYRGSTQILSF